MGKIDHIRDGAVGIFLLVIIWHITSLAIHSSAFPSPLDVATDLRKLLVSNVFGMHVLSSLRRLLFGFSAALAVGATAGYACGISSKIKRIVHPVIELFRPIPPIAWIPLAILWLGVGDSAASFIIFIAAFFPIFTNIYFGVINIPKEYHHLSSNFLLKPVQKFRHITFPSSLPHLFTGCKTSIGFAWMAVIAAEMVAGNQGLGYFIEANRVVLNTTAVLSTMIVIALVGFSMNKIMHALQKKIIHWSN